jgi:hypothetical protein
MSSLSFILTFFIKGRESRRTLLQGRSKGGLYPIPHASTTPSLVKQAFSTNKLFRSRCHAHLGHPSTTIVRFVLSKNSLPSSSDSFEELVCDACQQAKCHQLPYPTSSGTSKAPLELIFFDVWGPCCDSIVKNKYYVSFINDFCKFTWIYLLKHKSNVFQQFKKIQSLVEHLFDRKSLLFKLIGVENSKSCIPSSRMLVYHGSIWFRFF